MVPCQEREASIHLRLLSLPDPLPDQGWVALAGVSSFGEILFPLRRPMDWLTNTLVLAVHISISFLSSF